MAGFTIATKVDALVQRVNTELNNRPIAPTMITAEIAWMRDSAQKAGLEDVFAEEMFGDAVEERSPFEELAATEPELAIFSVVHKEWAPRAKVIARGTQVSDVYGILDGAAEKYLELGQTTYDQHLAYFLGNGQNITTRYDGQTFFHASAHECNPVRRGLKQFGNYTTATNLNRANLVAAFQKLGSRPDYNGKVNKLPGKLLILCSNEDQYSRASTEINGSLVANAAGTATQSNSLQGRAEVRILPDLADYDVSGGVGKAWYVCKLVSERFRPVVASFVERPYMFLEGVMPSEHLRTTRNLIKHGWRGTWAIGGLYPQLIEKYVES